MLSTSHVNYSKFNDEAVLINTAYNTILHRAREVKGNFDSLSSDEQRAIIKQVYVELDSEPSNYRAEDDIIRADMYTYLAVMRIIQRRTEVVTRLINHEIDMTYTFTQAESIALQIRMIIESIALASLSANKSLFKVEGDKFKEWWRAESIFKDIEKKNPDFYPLPLEEDPLDLSISDITYTQDGFMTRDEIVKVYNCCCDFLHAKNPYAEKRDHEGFISEVPNWMDQINKLLNYHQIKLLDDDGEYFVTMRDPDRGNLPDMCYRLTFHPDDQIKNIENTT